MTQDDYPEPDDLDEDLEAFDFDDDFSLPLANGEFFAIDF